MPSGKDRPDAGHGGIVELPIGDISIPVDILRPSKSVRSQIIKSLNNDASGVFVILKPKGKKFALVEGYEIYDAAKEHGRVSVPAMIMGKAEDEALIYLRRSRKIYANPIKLLKFMKQYVDKYGMARTIELFHIEPVHSRLYNVKFDNTVEEKLDGLFDHAYEAGTTATVNLNFFEKIAEINDVKKQLELIDAINITVDALRHDFKWLSPESIDILLQRIESSGKPNQMKSRDPEADTSEFKCPKCSFDMIASPPAQISPRKEERGMVVIEGDIGTRSVGLGKRLCRFLKLGKGDLPLTYISNDWGDLDTVEGQKKLIAIAKGLDRAVLQGTPKRPK